MGIKYIPLFSKSDKYYESVLSAVRTHDGVIYPVD